MSCNRSISFHLLRGLGAVLLGIAAFSHGAGHPVLLLLLLIGAMVLLGGCPTCWAMGLLAVCKAPQDPPQTS